MPYLEEYISCFILFLLNNQLSLIRLPNHLNNPVMIYYEIISNIMRLSLKIAKYYFEEIY